MAASAPAKKRGRPKKAEAEKPSPTEVVREWMKDCADQQRPSVRIPDVAKMALRHFTEHQPALVVELLEKQAYAVFYVMAQSLLAEGRSICIGGGEVVRSLDEARDAMKSRARSIFDRWAEHVGDRNVYLKEMDRDLLAAALQQRHSRIEHESAKLRFLGLVREGLPKGKKVGEHYTEAELHAFHEKAFRNLINTAG